MFVDLGSLAHPPVVIAKFLGLVLRNFDAPLLPCCGFPCFEAEQVRFGLTLFAFNCWVRLMVEFDRLMVMDDD